MNEEKTVKVRIAVMVSGRGDWTAVGWCDGKDYATAGEAEMMMDSGNVERDKHIVWVVAEVPVPDLDTKLEVEGKVE